MIEPASARIENNREESLEEKWLGIIRPGMLVTILGGPGSGKSGLTLYLGDILRRRHGLTLWLFGIPRRNQKYYPGFVNHIDAIASLSEAPHDAVLIVEEASLFAPARRAPSTQNLLLDQLKNIRRHRNLTIVVVVQRALEVDKNLAASTELLLLKKPEPFQSMSGSDRAQFRSHLGKAQELFEDPKIKNEKVWTYVSTLRKLIKNGLPSWWNEGISLSLGLGMEGRKSPFVMKRRERILEALVHEKEKMSLRESAHLLGVSHPTIVNYRKNYPRDSQSRLLEEEFDNLKREAEREFLKRNGMVEAEPEISSSKDVVEKTMVEMPNDELGTSRCAVCAGGVFISPGMMRTINDAELVARTVPQLGEVIKAARDELGKLLEKYGSVLEKHGLKNVPMEFVLSSEFNKLRQMELGVNPAPQGFVLHSRPNRIYLVPENILTPERARRVVKHMFKHVVYLSDGCPVCTCGEEELEEWAHEVAIKVASSTTHLSAEELNALIDEELAKGTR